MPAHVVLVDDNDKILTKYRSVEGSFIAAAAGDYADNDVISNSASNGAGLPISFAGAVRTAGGIAKIIGATLQFVAATAIAATTELQLFAQTPTATELDDNAAEGGIGAADAEYYVGSIAFAQGTDVGASTFCLPATLTPAAPLLIRCTATTLFGRLIFRDAETGETASMVVRITLYFED